MEVLECDTENIKQKRKWFRPNIYFLRQLFICTGGWTCCFVLGLSFGTPTVFIPQIRAEANSTEAVSETMASWIPSIIVYSGMPWSFILPLAMRVCGRKYTFMFVCICNLISFTNLYFGTPITNIVISQVISGINTGGHFTVSIMIITEYTSPKYRGIFLTAKAALLFWGIFIANTIGTFFHWKNIALTGMVCSIYSIFVALILPQSPYWLIMKHKFEKCSKVHRWLKGDDKKSEKALEQMINFQMNIDNRLKPTNFALKDYLSNTLNVMSNRKFYMPLALSILVNCSFIFLGKMVISIYALDIIRKITKDKQISAYTTMLILDVVTITCMYIGCVLVRMFTRRKLLITTSLVSIFFLLATSLYVFMIKLKILPEINYVALSLLVGYSVAMSVGPAVLCQAIVGELVSLESRALSSCCIDISHKLILGTVVKMSPYIFKLCGTDGAFLFFAVTSTIFLFLIYKYLPETKDKTLQEIGELMQGSNKTRIFAQESNCLTTGKNGDD